jgi:hypothetical protein
LDNPDDSLRRSRGAVRSADSRSLSFALSDYLDARADPPGAASPIEEQHE